MCLIWVKPLSLSLPSPTFSFRRCQLLLHQAPIRIKATGWRKSPSLNSDCERRELWDLREQSIVWAIRAPSVLKDGPENRRFHAVSKRVSQSRGLVTSFVMAHGLGSKAKDNVMAGWKGRPINLLVYSSFVPGLNPSSQNIKRTFLPPQRARYRA
jgi:hypothetical protein